MRTLTVTLAVLACTVTTLAAPACAQVVDGVDPRVYSKARKAEPNAVRDLAARPIDVSVAILRDGPSDALLAPLDAYPKGIDVGALRDAEKRALVIGAVHAVATKKPTGALALLERTAVDHRDALVRAEAAEQMGALGDDAIASLVRTAQVDSDVRVRQAALAGLGRVRSFAALDALTSFVTASNDVRLQNAAIRGLGTLGSRWAWQGKGDVATGQAIRDRALAVIGSVTKNGKNDEAIDFATRLLR